jgi:hypothetical protein
MSGEPALGTACRNTLLKTHPWDVWAVTRTVPASEDPALPVEYPLAYYRYIRQWEKFLFGAAIPLSSNMAYR